MKQREKKKRKKGENNGFDLGSPGSYYGKNTNYLAKSTVISPILNQFYDLTYLKLTFLCVSPRNKINLMSKSQPQT